MTIEGDPLQYLVHHLFLPLRLPDRDDYALENDATILKYTLSCVEAFVQSGSTVRREPWNTIVKMLARLRQLEETHALNPVEVEHLLRTAQPGEVLVFRVRAQNACFIVRKQTGRTVYESFEVDPPNEVVMGTVGRIVSSFPGPSFTVPDDITPEDQRELAYFLAKMDVEVLDSTATTFKAGSEVQESRETADPHYVTQLLTSILHGIPGSHRTEVRRIDKRIRNDIVGNGGSKPWRRSPLWLVIRVSIQTTLCQLLGVSSGQNEYKAFMTFLMAEALLIHGCAKFPTDLLHCMQAKVSRRLAKLSVLSGPVVQKATTAVETSKAIIDARWSDLHTAQGRSPSWTPNDLDIQADTQLTLNNSSAYIFQRLQPAPARGIQPEFHPSEYPRLNKSLQDGTGLSSQLLTAALAKDPFVALVDIEEFVQQKLDEWVLANSARTSACSTLAQCIETYSGTAKLRYKDNPEAQSMMVLTVMQLWVALDRLAVTQIPLLSRYSPEIPRTLLQPLLLRSSSSIQQYVAIQDYLRERHERATRGTVFRNKITSNSFSIKYFDSSPELYTLKGRIEMKAQQERDAKAEELRIEKTNYQNYCAATAQMVHDHAFEGRRPRMRVCPKCERQRAAQEMKIDVHEWPLPEGDLEAKATVFELQCPTAFRTWRSTTYSILYDMCRPGLPVDLCKTGEVRVKLSDYPGLKDYMGEISRVTYASWTKSFSTSEYSHLPVADAEIGALFVNNGLKFRLFDKSLPRWVSKDSFSDCGIDALCTFKLPRTSPYHLLQYAVSGTSHGPNTPIAQQAEVPPQLSLHEHAAFGTLRSGPRLQWPNILRELRTRILTFARQEVQVLLFQAAFQVGPVCDLEREPEWHMHLKCPQFGARLLDEIDDLVSDIEDNWLHVITLQTAILLVTRLIASNMEAGIVDRAVQVLRRARGTAFTWMSQISGMLQDTKNIDETQQRLCAVAATCRATYDVDPCHLDHILWSDEDVSVLVQCSIQVHDNTSPDKISSHLRRLLVRDARLSQMLLSKVGARIQDSRTGLDNAVAAIWSAYRPGTPWRQLLYPNERWVMTTTSSTDTTIPSKVHLNLIDGTLLIDGKPLGRLPSAIVKHSTYKRLLGSKILDVVPSTLPNMDFSTRDEISPLGPHVHFKLCDTNLIIQAVRGAETYELIPHTHFANDLPIFFVEKYAHWLQLSPRLSRTHAQIEFRPLISRWDTSQDNWKITISPVGVAMRHGNSEVQMLYIHSPTYKMVSGRLKPLEIPGYLHITSTGGRNLSIDLPRYKLSFFLNGNEEIESTNMRDMVIDSNQFSGTMVGLTSQLVLKSGDVRRERFPRSRCVIIPFSQELNARSEEYHVVLNVPVENRDSIQYFKYDIDTDLGCLVGPTLLSDLFRILLHASTSYPLPDPLTGRTGTEEALNELGSARCSSFQRLSDDEQQILGKIAQLVPRRRWQPHHLRVMQTIKWHPTGPLAQHWGFYLRVRAILEFHEKLAMFSSDILSKNVLEVPQDDHLHNRAVSRSFYLYPPEYGVVDATTQYDRAYPTPDNKRRKGPSEDVVTLAADVSAMVRQRFHVVSHTIPDLWETLKAWGALKNQEGPLFSLRYNGEFLRPDFARLWIPIYEAARKHDRPLDMQAKLTFTLPAMVYGSKENLRYIPTILAFAKHRIFTRIDPPRWDSYNLSIGVAPDHKAIANIIEKYALPLYRSPPDSLVKAPRESYSKFLRRREAHRMMVYGTQARSMADLVVAQWPCQKPFIPSNDHFTAIDVRSTDLKDEMDKYFSNCYRNKHLYAYVQEVQRVLNSVHQLCETTVPSRCVAYALPVPVVVTRPRHNAPSLGDLLRREPPAMSNPPTALSPPPFDEGIATDSGNSALQPLVTGFTHGENAVRIAYGQALKESLESYNLTPITTFTRSEITFSHTELFNHLTACNDHVTMLFNSILKALSPANAIEMAQSMSSNWSRITTRSLLGLLSGTSQVRLTRGWKAVLVLFGQSIVQLQRAQRLVHYGLSNTVEDFVKELENDKFGEDIAFTKYPEWLLIQIEGNFMARPIQSRVAEEMMFPQGNQNSLLQLNMGEGKTSVIVPLIASHLADGEKLVRVVVLKPLASQMFSLLVRRLSGLANRRIFYFPFSRDVKASKDSARRLQSLFELCMRDRGILIVQPEHILSFKLMGIDLAIASGGTQTDVADALLASQLWLADKSRDILDESDEILSVKYQLVYASGRQEPLEDHPDRWLRMQEILTSVKQHARRLAELYPTGLEVDKTTKISEFPLIRILDMTAGEDLIDSVAKDLLAHTRFRLLSDHAHEAILRFITERTPDADSIVLVRARCESTSLWKCLLLFRGIIGGGILRFLLQEKRWRVNFGLDLSRTLLAVPYRAKDVPSLRADFGHPDVAIGLTCLSYYYGGLTDKEMDTCFHLLFKLDNPALEYETWIKDEKEVPQPLREIVGVNTEDPVQRQRLTSLLRRNNAVIDFYLSNVVFPKEAKQFPQKLATSAWDLAETKRHVTTGFSGTNDNQHLLPTSIQQRDLLDQGSTNARVLTYLLQPENNKYACLHRDGEPQTSRDFLQRMIGETPVIRVLLDVGAQMLDMKNSEIASAWITLAPDVQAIVFFDNDQLTVMSRDGTTESFLSSQYNQQLDLCGIYLDDEHTRGTDLKLPKDFRAAVTLGPKMNKDRLIQGCMRMRKLGQGQSVMFFAPPDVDRAIRDVANLDPLHLVTSLDILRWAMTETCDYITHHLSHWAQQGVDYGRRNSAWINYSADPAAVGAIDDLRFVWQEPDARSLEDMYGLSPRAPTQHPAFRIPELSARLRQLGVRALDDITMDEEQEREIAHEQETERMVERPPKAEPAPHAVHEHVRKLITDRVLIPAGSDAIVPLFSPLRQFGAHTWSPTLWSTRDFATTIVGSLDSAADYQRPVTWVLSLRGYPDLIALSPFEANELLPAIKRSGAVHLHMYAARVTKATKTLEDLTFFNIPALPPVWEPPCATDIGQLNLWAGQLYLKDFEAYTQLCLVLGLIGDNTRGEVRWEKDGFVKRENRSGEMLDICKLETSALPFLKEVVSLRRKGMNYTSTHMGKILGGGVLTQADFEP